MKKLIIIAVSLLTLSACSKSGSGTSSTPSSDTVFNGSYFQISYNGKNFYSKDAAVGVHHYSMVLTNTLQWTTGSTGTIVQVSLNDITGIYGTTSALLYFAGLGAVGNYTQTNLADGGYISTLMQTNPGTEFTDTSGSANITYMGSDYIQGTFNVTLYTSGISYPATGSFKIYH